MSNKSGAERIYRGSCPFLFKIALMKDEQIV